MNIQYFIFLLCCCILHFVCGEYLGCYVDQSTRDVPDPSHSFYPSSVAGCINFCSTKNTKYAAVQNGNECRCGNSYGAYGTATDCSSHCADDSINPCGGGWRNSVYRVSSSNYVGCFVDNSTRDLPFTVSGGGTVDGCKAACAAAGYVYAGAQYGSECHCGNSYGLVGPAPDSDCNSVCSSNSSQSCGGTWRNSVYRTGKSPTPISNSLLGKTLFGFQGFFRKPGEGNGNTHWSSDNTIPNANNIVVDFWPDVSDIPPACRFDTQFTLRNGSNAQLFTSYCPGTIDAQFRWLQSHGLDGVFAHRTFNDAKQIVYDNTKVLEYVRASAEKYGRIFAIEYGISDDSLTDDLDGVLYRDFTNTISSVVTSKNYLYHNGKPVISIWGCGISISIASLGQCRKVVQHFRTFAYVVLGVSAYWRDHITSGVADSDVYLLGHVLNPWTVGAYGAGDFASFHTNRIIPDMTYLQNRSVGYAPVIWPGSSWHNQRFHTGNGNPTINENPRNHGVYFQTQANSALADKPFFAYLAMFDELNEGTHYIPFVKNASLPTTGQFIAVDDKGFNIPPDYYLQLAGNFTSALKVAKGLPTGL